MKFRSIEIRPDSWAKIDLHVMSDAQLHEAQLHGWAVLEMARLNLQRIAQEKARRHPTGGDVNGAS